MISRKLSFASYRHRGFHNFVWTLQERVVVALPRRVGFILVVEVLYASLTCDFDDIRAFNVSFLRFADCCFFLFLHCTSSTCFHFP